jgi:hypothetical protein
MSASPHLEPCVVTHGAGGRVAKLWLGAALFGLLHGAQAIAHGPRSATAP